MTLRRFFAWLVRPQFSALMVALAFIIGAVPPSLPWWVRDVVCFGAGIVFMAAQNLIRRLLNRRAHG